MDEIKVVDTWFNYVSAQGLGVAFTATFLLIVLIGMGILAKMAIRWLPKLIESTINTQVALVENNDLIIEMAERDRQDIRAIIRVGSLLVNGLHELAEKHKDRLGVGSDVVRLLEEAKSDLALYEEERRNELARRRERRDKRRRSILDTERANGTG